MNQSNLNYQKNRLEHTRKKFDLLQLPDISDKTYADLGCNAGMFCKFAADAGARKIVGVDIDNNLLSVARENVPEANFYNFRFEDIEIPNQTFDIITIASAIHYSQNFIRVANVLLDLLSDDGLLVIEGGLFDPIEETNLNTPVPNWRKIGDHCRHLSMNFVKKILFPSCDVSLIGPSLQQDGDNLKRYVLHVRKRTGQKKPRTKRHSATIAVSDFARAILISQTTIDTKYSIKSFMDDINDLQNVEFSNHEIIAELIKNEIIYCTKDWGDEIIISDPNASEIHRLIASKF